MGEPPLSVNRHRSKLGCWEMVSREPHPLLAGQVLRYAGYLERTAGPLRRLEPPFGGVVVILSFGERLQLFDAEGRAGSHASFTAGLSNGPTITEHAGSQHGIQIDLTPPAARALLGLPLRELTNRVVDLEDVLGREAGELIERLHAAADWRTRFQMLDAMIARRTSGAPEPPPAIVGAWQQLRQSHGRAKVEDIARELGYSRRRLSARFAYEFGLPPKTFARVLRFERAVARLGRDDGTRFAEIAYDCGYFDQAHLNRDFREFAGTSPGNYVGRLLPDGGGVSAAEDVPFVQDADRAAA